MKATKYIIITAVIALASAFSAAAQNNTTGALVDSVVYKQSPALDSTLVGKSIFSILASKGKGSSANVTVHQSSSILSAFNSQIASNSSRKISGYRIRIFNDNKQSARNASEYAMSRFKGICPGISAYRTYDNPFFKVTVGDFRTKSEALRVLQQIKGSFPSAFIVKESAINYPSAI